MGFFDQIKAAGQDAINNVRTAAENTASQYVSSTVNKGLQTVGLMPVESGKAPDQYIKPRDIPSDAISNALPVSVKEVMPVGLIIGVAVLVYLLARKGK